MSSELSNDNTTIEEIRLTKKKNNLPELSLPIIVAFISAAGLILAALITAGLPLIQHSPRQKEPPFHASINSHAKSKALVVKRSTLLDGISLKSVRAVDYKNLKNLLASRQWEEADKQTRIVMIQAADRVQEDYFDRIALLNFPCEDLRTIDALWVKASYGKFGFSVQNKIWKSVNGLPTMGSYGSTIQNHAQFSARVGWRESLDRERSFFEDQWFNYESLDFHLNGLDTSIGQLPAYAFFWKDGTSESNEDHLSLMIRFTRCSAN